MGVMVEVEAYCHPSATILDGSRVNLEQGSPFPVILVPSSCFSRSTVSAPCGGDLAGLASLWLSVTLSGATAAGPGLWVQREVSGFAFKVCKSSRADLILPSLKLNW